MSTFSRGTAETPRLVIPTMPVGAPTGTEVGAETVQPLALPPLPYNSQHGPITTGGGVKVAVTNANAFLSTFESTLNRPGGIAGLAESFASTQGNDPRYHGMNGVEVFQRFASTLQAVTHLVNSGEFREDSTSLRRSASDLVALTRELNHRVG